MIRMKFACLEVISQGARIIFDDGATVEGHAQDTSNYSVIAARCGYGYDLQGYAREHEFAHLFVEEALHNRPSRILWALAHGQMLSGKDAVYEELAAQSFQRFLRANEWPIIGGVNWHRLGERARAYLDEVTL